MNFSWLKPENEIRFPKLNLDLGDIPMGFSIGDISVRFYGVIIAIGLVLAVIYGLRRSKQFGLKDDDILDGVIFIVPLAIICARLYYCIFQWDEYKANPVSILYIWKGGLAIYGGVIGAAIGVVAFSFIKKVRLAAVLDLVAISFLIGQSIGRWGNFMNREAFGAVTDSFLGMEITSDITGVRATYHPTFLYESVWNALGFVVLHFLSKRRQYDGQMALGYAAWYGLGRTFIEGLRMDSLKVGDIRVSQLLAAVTCFLAVAVLVLMTFRKHKNENLFVNVVARRQEEAAAALEAASLEEAEIETEE